MSISRLFSLAILLLCGSFGFSQPNWTYLNTGTNHTILISAAINPSIGGQALQPGDYIGVFFEDNGEFGCGGYLIWDGVTTAISAWGNDPLTPQVDGFSPGQPFLFMIWREADAAYCPAIAVFDSAFPVGNGFVSDGMSSLASLIGMEPLDLGSDTSICEGSTLTLSPGQYPSYQWSTGDTGPILELVEDGVFGLTVTTPFGDMTDEISLTLLPLPAVVIAAEPMTNQQITLHAGLGFSTYLWSTGESSESIEVSQNGLYQVTVTNSFGCAGAGEIEVTQLSIAEPGNHPSFRWFRSNHQMEIEFAQPCSGVFYLFSFDGKLLKQSGFFQKQGLSFPFPEVKGTLLQIRLTGRESPPCLFF